MAVRHGIETWYRKTKFRSMLEARWAAWFDIQQLRWVYEPFEADYWIPDFLLLGRRPLLVDVRPLTEEGGFHDRGEFILRRLKGRTESILVVGAIPGYSLLLEAMPAWSEQEDKEVVSHHSPVEQGNWIRCGDDRCDSIGVVELNRDVVTPCGGPRYGKEPLSTGDMIESWNLAGTMVRWEPKDQQIRTGEEVVALNELRQGIKWNDDK